MSNEIRENLKDLLESFKVSAFIYNDNFMRSFKDLPFSEQSKIFGEIEKRIRADSDKEIYSLNQKDNLFYILNYFRMNYHDDENLDRINKLNSILHLSGEANVLNFYIKQYNIRYNAARKRELREIHFLELQEKTCSSIGNDYSFLYSLMYGTESDFIMKNLCSELSFSNLVYLLYKYPVFREPSLNERIIGLLEMNASAVGDPIIIVSSDGENVKNECSKELGQQCKQLIKYINRETR